MTSIRVTHTIDGLERDMRRIATTAKPRMARVVKQAVKVGGLTARDIAQRRSGPHGKNYYKRITSEMTGPLSGEYGPTGVVDNNAVGAGWRHGVNTDLEKSQDIIGPKLARDAANAIGSLFWNG